MANKLLVGILVVCVAALTMVSLPGCATTPSPTPPANWEPGATFGADFETGDNCAHRYFELPYSYGVELTIGGDNWPWGNVPKMWIYLNGNKVAYDVGRMTSVVWRGNVQKGDKVEFKACAETHGKSAGVYCGVTYGDYRPSIKQGLSIDNLTPGEGRRSSHNQRVSKWSERDTGTYPELMGNGAYGDNSSYPYPSKPP